MANIIKLFKEGKPYTLNSVENGDFFEFHNRLFVRIKKDTNYIICLGINNKKIYNLNPLNKIYKCSNVEIKYTLEQL